MGRRGNVDIASPYREPVLGDCSSQTENQCRYARNAFREDSQSRACVSVQRRGPMFLRGWQGSRSGATREAIRAVHIDGPARSVPSRKYVTIHPPIHPVWLRCLRTPTLPRSPRSGALPAGRAYGEMGKNKWNHGDSSAEFRQCYFRGQNTNGDFWFLLVVSKGTRRRQGNWGDVDVEFGFRLLLQADRR